MKLSTSISLCFLITLIFFLSSPTITALASSSSSSSMLLQTGKPSVRKLGNHQQDKLNIKVMSKHIIKGVPAEADDNGEDLVYHVDYHGVSTHPTPTPKHPRP
ncbi:hypothetical protein MKW94_002281 [Papaver nudicaule]|uniref:Uncharacterized protein n=1 Tax=Papaver nudicaule TaxID=74823 RepID=A0AA41S2N0_PAPNU|nr:hypothetical protein [Papaver nudicaule]